MGHKTHFNCPSTARPHGCLRNNILQFCLRPLLYKNMLTGHGNIYDRLLPLFWNKKWLPYNLFSVGWHRGQNLKKKKYRERKRCKSGQRKKEFPTSFIQQLSSLMLITEEMKGSLALSSYLSAITNSNSSRHDASNLLTLLAIYCRGKMMLRKKLRWHISRSSNRRVVSCVWVMNKMRVVSQVGG